MSEGKKWVLIPRAVLGEFVWNKLVEFCRKGDYNAIVIVDEGGEFTKVVEAGDPK